MGSGKGMGIESVWKTVKGCRFREEKHVNRKVLRRRRFGTGCAITGKVKSEYKGRRKETKKE